MAKRARSTPGAAADFENLPAGVAVKVDEPEEMVELFEMILIEIVEKAARSDRMPGDFEIVNVAVPVVANRIDGRHALELYRSSQLSALS